MNQRSDLLEDVLQRIISSIEKEPWDVHCLKIEIKKLNPAIKGNCGASAVEIEKFYHS